MCQVENNYTLKFDGSAWPNPGGTAAYGYILFRGKQMINSGHGLIGSGPKVSNNMAEHFAAAKGLESFLKYCPNVKTANLNILGDSQLVINHLNGKWKLRPDKLYYEEGLKSTTLLNKIRKMGVKVTCNWIPREHNQDCDDLSKLDQQFCPK